MPTLDELITIQDFRQWVRNDQISELDFVNICSKLSVEDAVGIGERVLVYRGNIPGIQKAVAKNNDAPLQDSPGTQRPGNLDHDQLTPNKNSQLAIVEHGSADAPIERRIAERLARRREELERRPQLAIAAMPDQRMQLTRYGDHSMIQPGVPPWGRDAIFRDRIRADSRLQEILEVHNYWLKFLKKKARWCADDLYTRSVPCRNVGEGPHRGCEDQGCTSFHGIAYMFFMLSGLLLFDGYGNHRSVRRSINDLGMKGFRPLVCITWAIRRILSPNAKCQAVTCVDTAEEMDVVNRSSRDQVRRFHSFWLVEEWTVRLFRQMPDGNTFPEVMDSMRALGLAAPGPVYKVRRA